MKYRVWDKTLKRYDTYINVAQNGRLLHSHQKELTQEEIDDYIIEQYTGINDINGKEIYVGDIVKGYHKRIFCNASGKVYKGKARYRVKSELNRYTLYDLRNIEIIGNIHYE